MAENVYIDGIAEGSFVDALRGVPPWATQKTAEDIQIILNKILKTNSDGFEQMIKSYADGASTGTLSAAEIKRLNDEISQLGSSLERSNAAQLRELDAAARRAAADATLNQSQGTVTGFFKKMAPILGLVSAAGLKVKGTMDQYVSNFNEMNQAGINVASGTDGTVEAMRLLQDSVRGTGLTLEVLRETSLKYSKAINTVGFVKFTNIAAKAAKELESVGYSATQSADLVGAFLDQQSNFTNIRTKSEAEIVASAATFGEQLDRTSKQLGISREELLANGKAISESTSIAVITASLGEKAASRVNAALNGLPPDLASQLAEAAADASVSMGVRNKTIDNMITSGSSYSAAMLKMSSDITKMNPEEWRAKWKTILNSDAYSKEIVRLQQLAKSGHATAAEAQKTIVAMKIAANKTGDTAQAGLDAARKTAEATGALGTQQEKLASGLQAAIAPTIETINLLTGGLKLLNAGIESSYKGIEGLISPIGVSYAAAGLALVGLIASLGLATSALGIFTKSLLTSRLPTGGGGGGGGGAGGGRVLRTAKVAGGLAAAGLVGWEIGTAISENLSIETNDEIGSMITKVLAAAGNQNAKDDIERVKKYNEASAEEEKRLQLSKSKAAIDQKATIDQKANQKISATPDQTPLESLAIKDKLSEVVSLNKSVESVMMDKLGELVGWTRQVESTSKTGLADVAMATRSADGSTQQKLSELSSSIISSNNDKSATDSDLIRTMSLMENSTLQALAGFPRIFSEKTILEIKKGLYQQNTPGIKEAQPIELIVKTMAPSVSSPNSKEIVPPKASEIERTPFVGRSEIAKDNTGINDGTPFSSRPQQPGMTQQPMAADINNVLSNQTAILSQMAQGIGSLVAVNKDILKFTRANT